MKEITSQILRSGDVPAPLPNFYSQPPFAAAIKKAVEIFGVHEDVLRYALSTIGGESPKYDDVRWATGSLKMRRALNYPKNPQLGWVAIYNSMEKAVKKRKISNPTDSIEVPSRDKFRDSLFVVLLREDIPESLISVRPIWGEYMRDNFFARDYDLWGNPSEDIKFVAEPFDEWLINKNARDDARAIGEAFSGARSHLKTEQRARRDARIFNRGKYEGNS